MAQLIFVVSGGGGGGASSNPVIETFAGAARNMITEDTNKVIRCTSAVPVVITVLAAQQPGTTVEYVREGAGTLTIAPGAGMTLLVPAAFLLTAAEQFSAIVVTILDTNEAIVRGDLTPV